jgi:hypothetical protein
VNFDKWYINPVVIFLAEEIILDVWVFLLLRIPCDNTKIGILLQKMHLDSGRSGERTATY